MRAAILAKNTFLALLGLAVIWFFAVSLPFTIADWDSGSFPFPLGVVSLIAWVPMITGGCVIIWCYCLFFLVGRGTPWPFDPPEKLVLAGPYRFVRNPMEGSFFLIILGEAFLFQSVSLLLYLLVGFGLFHS
jgi:protein-S-isoprenylcysteine O-methyltransferase Ste14